MENTPPSIYQLTGISCRSRYNSFHEDIGKISLNRGQVVRASVHGSEGRGFDPARGKNFSFGRNLLKIFALPFFDAGNPFLMEFGPVFR